MINILSIALNLFILMDAIGNVPIFCSLLKDIPVKKQRTIIFRELVIALLLIIFFNFVGDFLLDLLKVSQEAVMIAGSIILFLIAIKMIFPATKDNGYEKAKPLEKEPFVVPLAVPLVAGPAILAAVILYAKRESALTMVSAIGIAWGASTIILLAGASLKKLLGDKVLSAGERLMGLILTLIAVQMFLEGLKLYSSDLYLK